MICQKRRGPPPTRHGRAGSCGQRGRPAAIQRDDISLTPEFIIFWNGGLPPAFSSGISSRPRNQAFAPPTGPNNLRGGSASGCADCEGVVKVLERRRD